MSQVTGPVSINQLAVGTAAVQVTATPGRLAWGVTIRPLSANTGKIYVGTSSGVTTASGFELAAGEQHTFHVFDPSTLWLIASAASQAVCFEFS